MKRFEVQGRYDNGDWGKIDIGMLPHAMGMS